MSTNRVVREAERGHSREAFGGQLAGAVAGCGADGKREQAPRTPNASRCSVAAWPLRGAAVPLHSPPLNRYGLARRDQGCSKVGPGHSKPETRRPKAERNPQAEVRIDSHPGGATANRIRPFSEFGLRAAFGLRVSAFGFQGGRTCASLNWPDFRAALPEGCPGVFRAWQGGLGLIAKTP